MMGERENLFAFYDGENLIRSATSALISRTNNDTTNTTSAEPAKWSLTPEEEAHFKRLTEGFEYSRWFYLSYQVAIVGVVGVAAIWRWAERRKRRRRTRTTGDKHAYEAVGRVPIRSQIAQEGATAQESKHIAPDEFFIGPQQQREDGTSGPASSSSSTRHSPRSSLSKGSVDRIVTSGYQSPKQEPGRDVSNATSPLLSPVDREDPHPHQQRTLLTPWHWSKAALMYQPPPLPVLRRIIPENLTTLVILALLGINLFYLTYNIPFHTITWVDIISDRAGLLWAANLPWLYLLAAKNQPLKRLTGDSYENLNLIHRRQGEWMSFLAVLHFGAMVAAYYLHLQRSGTLWWFLTINYITWGVYAFVAYEILYLTSLSSFREWWYELFLASHVFLQAAGLALLWLHHFRAQTYVGVSLVIFLLDRTVWRLGIKRMNVKVDLEILEDGETVRVSGSWLIKKPSKRSWRHLFGSGMQQGWLPSQHVFITVPAISRKHTWQAHPMTIASAAPTFDDSGHAHAWFNLIIRAKNGFSKELLEHARVFDTATVRLDGPYGSLHALEMLQTSDVAVIVAGGSGIAVAYPMLWDLLHNAATTSQRVCLIWVVQDASHVSWLGNSRLEELRELGCRIVVPPPSRKHGRPDVCGLLRDCVDELAGASEDSVGVVVSGPDGLNRDVRNTCAKMVGRGRDVSVAVEKFGW